MPNYRRWFFTVNLLERRKALLVDHIDVLRAALAKTRRRYPFVIDAVVVLPDHIHAAAFVVSPRRARRYFSGRLGGRRRCRWGVRREMKTRLRMEFGAAKTKMADYADANRALRVDAPEPIALYATRRHGVTLTASALSRIRRLPAFMPCAARTCCGECAGTPGKQGSPPGSRTCRACESQNVW
jgi:REP element-mobilizing transposase RayT